MTHRFEKHFSITESDVVAEVKDGNTFRFFLDDTINTASDYFIYVSIPEDKIAGVLSRRLTVLESTCVLEIFKIPTVVGAGTPIPIHRHNADIDIFSTITLESDANLTVAPENIGDIVFAPAFAAQGANPGSITDVDDVLLQVFPPGGTFGIRITNIGPNTARFLLKYSWQEHSIHE